MDFLFSFLRILLDVLTVAIIVRAFLSWLPFRIHYTLMSFLYFITEPILAPIRKITPRIGMLDISPLIAVVLLQVILWLLP